MEKFLAAATSRKSTQNLNPNAPKQMKFTIPSFDQFLDTVRSQRHPTLKLTNIGQKHIVASKIGITLYVPNQNDKSFIHQTIVNEQGHTQYTVKTDESGKPQLKTDATFLELKNRVYGNFANQVTLTWDNGARAVIQELACNLIEFYNVLNRVFKNTTADRLNVSNAVRNSCLYADTTDLQRAAKFIICGLLCCDANRTKRPMPIEIYQFIVPRNIDPETLCYGQYYRECDAVSWKSIKQNELVLFSALGHVSSLRNYMTESRIEMLEAGSALVTFPETADKRIPFASASQTITTLLAFDFDQYDDAAPIPDVITKDFVLQQKNVSELHDITVQNQVDDQLEQAGKECDAKVEDVDGIQNEMAELETV